MRALLIYPRPDESKGARFGFSYEQVMLATILQPYWEVTIKDYSCEIYDEQWLIQKVKSGFFDILLIECDSFALKRAQNLKHAREIISMVQGYVYVIAYGNYCSITKKHFAQADYTVQTNDINAMLAQINMLSDVCQIPEIPNDDNLPYINRGLLSNIDYYRRNGQNTLLQTSKGCENTCIFCQRKGWQNHYIAYSDEYVIGEFQHLHEQGYVNVWIIDENFTFNLVRAKRILTKLHEESLTRGMNLFISSWTNIDQEFLDLAACCNIKIISFGIESGNEEILAFYRKNIDLDEAAAMVQYANSIGIFTVGNFILGAPIETEETIEKTFSFILRCNFDQVNIKILDYMIGSELYDSLPLLLKGSDHIFACAENGLTTLTMSTMIQKKDTFLKGYYDGRKKEIEKKIVRFGMPYML